MNLETQKKHSLQVWTCPACGRHFERTNQSHSCKVYPLDRHFDGKEQLRKLFDRLCKAISTGIGPFTIDSVECCIHLVRQSTFAAVKVMKDKLRVDFALDNMLANKRIDKTLQMSAHRYLYYTDIRIEADIDEALLQWLSDAYNIK